MRKNCHTDGKALVWCFFICMENKRADGSVICRFEYHRMQKGCQWQAFCIDTLNLYLQIEEDLLWEGKKNMYCWLYCVRSF